MYAVPVIVMAVIVARITPPGLGEEEEGGGEVRCKGRQTSRCQRIHRRDLLQPSMKRSLILFLFDAH